LVAHLGLAILLYAAIVWTALDLLRPQAPAAPAGLRRAAAAIVALIFVTLLAGGFVAGLNAGLVYNTFPLMDGHFVPVGYGQLSPWWRNWFENVAAVQFNHRLLAETTFTATVLLWLWSRRLVLAPHGRQLPARRRLPAIGARHLDPAPRRADAARRRAPGGGAPPLHGGARRASRAAPRGGARCRPRRGGRRPGPIGRVAGRAVIVALYRLSPSGRGRGPHCGKVRGPAAD